MTLAALQAADLYSQLVGRRTGILKEVYESPRLQGEPEIRSYSARMCDLSRLGKEPGTTACGGAGFSREEALLACLGEAVERYCCQFHKEDGLVLGSHENVTGPAVNPRSWALFSQKQYFSRSFPFAPMTRGTPLWWTWAESLTEKRVKLVPACMVYMPYPQRHPEPLITPAISTGLSCANTVEEAALKSLYEIVERDALAITWLKEVPTWELTDLPEDILRTFNSGPIHYCAYDLTSDADIPVYLVLSIGNSDWGKLITVGTAAGLDPLAALKKAFLENAHGRLCLMALKRDNPKWLPTEDFTNVTSFHDHALVLTCRPDLLDQLWFLGARGKRPFKADLSWGSEDHGYTLSACVHRLEQLGLETLMKDLTTCDIDNLGLRVVRTMIPGMHPLHGDHRLPFLGGKRLQEAASVFCVAPDDVLAPERFNPIPHPLP